jgi:hypothetical protein
MDGGASRDFRYGPMPLSAFRDMLYPGKYRFELVRPLLQYDSELHVTAWNWRVP